jgi:Uncharacterized conserved protein
MDIKEQIKNDLITAMKNKDKDALNTLRSVKGAVQLEVINNKKEENNDLYLDVINKQIKMRNDSITEFEKAGREDLIFSYKKEIEILSNYMPKMFTDEELSEIIDNVFNELKPEGMKDFGSVMKTITPLVKNRCDMSKLSSLIKAKLN